MSDETPKFIPGEITITIRIKATKEEEFDLDMKLDREINLKTECGVMDEMEDDEEIVKDLSESGVIQAVAHLLHHELEEAGGEGPKNDKDPKDLLN